MKGLGILISLLLVGAAAVAVFNPQLIDEFLSNRDIPEIAPYCAENVIDFEDLEAGDKVFNQYGEFGIVFPFTPHIIEPLGISTISGSKALTTYYPGSEFGGKLIIEFTSAQTCVSMHVGLLDDTGGNKVTARLIAYDAEAIIIPGYGVDVDPERQVAVSQVNIGSGPKDVFTRIRVETGDEPLIHRVELSLSGGYFPVIDDLIFSTVGIAYPEVDSTPVISLQAPVDKGYISGFATSSGAIDIMGTIHEEFKLREVTVTVTQGDESRSGNLAFSGQPPDYTFGGINIHSLIFPGENRINIQAHSFSGKTGYKQIRVYYEPLLTGTDAELLILAPDDFYEPLTTLRDWKNDTGISSHIMTLSSIEHDWRHSNSKDLPEQIKRAIAHAYLNHDTRYVMLAGDGDRFPVRYHRTGSYDYVEGETWGIVYAVTDLYYGCLFKSDGDFDDWDGNQNGLIGEWGEPHASPGQQAESFEQINIDDCSLKPDVAVGRVPASTPEEVQAYVDKVIEYESWEMSKWSWQRRVVIWDCTSIDFPDYRTKLYQVYDQYLSHFMLENLLQPANYADFTGSERLDYIIDIWRPALLEELNQGVGLAIHMGHGSRTSVGVLSNQLVSELEQYGRYPIIITSGCDTGKFVYEFDIYKDIDGNYPPCWPNCSIEGWEHPRPEPAYLQPSEVDVESMAEVLLLTPNQGGVGFLGASMGTNVAGPEYVELFVSAWAQEDVLHLGDMWTYAVTEFVENYFEAGSPTAGAHWFSRDDFMAHHIHKFILFGDPSLRLKKPDMSR